MSAEAVAAVPAREEIPLDPAHRQYLAGEADTGSLIKLAFRVSLAAPLILFAVCLTLTKMVARVPVIGWLLGIYGVILTVAGVVLGIVAVPLVFVVLVPTVLLGRRPKLNRDLATSSALRQTGTFEVNEDGRGGAALVSAIKKFRLSKDDMDGIRPALTSTEQGVTLTGALVHAQNAGDLLAAYDDSGRRLIGVTA
jgi:hypothetical protein